MISLNLCKEGDIVEILRIDGTGLLRKRLLEMGFMKGEKVRIIKYAPLKDPMEIVVRDSHISLRLKEACMINVTPVVKQSDGEQKT